MDQNILAQLPLKEQEFLLDLSKEDYIDNHQNKQNLKSQNKNFLSSIFKRLRNSIPSIEEANYRQKQIKSFHNRNYYKRRRDLEQIFKQNMRLYSQLNKQKSHYLVNFKKIKPQNKSKKSHSKSCSQPHTVKYLDLRKNSKDQYFQLNKTKFQKKQSHCLVKTESKIFKIMQNRCLTNKTGYDYYIKNKNYQKNKTQMITKKEKYLNVNITNNYQFIEPSIISDQSKPIARENFFSQIKNPICMRLKRARPCSGFRY